MSKVRYRLSPEEQKPADALAQRATLTQLVVVYEQAVRDIQSGFAQVHAAEQRLQTAFGTDVFNIYVKDAYGTVNFGDPKGCLVEVRRNCWRYLLEALEVRRMASMSRWKELSDYVRLDAEPPEITLEAVLGLGEQLCRDLPSMLEEKVREVFDLLRPRSGRYKTNTQFELGKRVVLECMLERWFLNEDYPRVELDAQVQMNALESVFQELDGRGSITKQHHSELKTAIEKTPFGEKGVTRYFAFRAYNKGTLHLEFLRPDLVKRLNQIAGGKNLKQNGAQR